jgi:hypothetical protein
MHLSESLMRSVFKPFSMPYTKLITFAALLALLSCNKEAPDEPINTGDNNLGLNCATCPSIFHSFTDLTSEFKETCDDFTNVAFYPSELVLEDGIIGYTQEATQPITMLEGGFAQINGSETEPGIYGASSLVFEFVDGQQTASFIVYGFDGSFEEMGFSVNGSSTVYYTAPFPLTLEGVTVDLDLSTPDIGSWEAFEVTFTGEIDYITHLLFESGITDLCVNKELEPEPPVINQDNYIYFDAFYNYDGTVLGSYPNHKTPLGYYGLQATNMVINFDEFLGYDPTKIGFVHAYHEGGSNLVNIQLPTTPLIITIPDSLNYFLEPYGYSVEHYYKTDAKLWVDQTSAPLSGNYLDSLIIKGDNLNAITLGANLLKSELRSICTYYEQ